MNILFCSASSKHRDFFLSIVSKLEPQGDRVYYKFVDKEKILTGEGLLIFGMKESFLQIIDFFIIDISSFNQDLMFLLSNTVLFRKNVLVLFSRSNPPSKIINLSKEGRLKKFTLLELESEKMEDKIWKQIFENRKNVDNQITDLLIKIKMPRKARDLILENNSKSPIDGELGE